MFARNWNAFKVPGVKAVLWTPQGEIQFCQTVRLVELRPWATQGFSRETFLLLSMVCFLLICLSTGFIILYSVSFLDLSGYVWIVLQHAVHQGIVIIYIMIVLFISAWIATDLKFSLFIPISWVSWSGMDQVLILQTISHHYEYGQVEENFHKVWWDSLGRDVGRQYCKIGLISVLVPYNPI